MALFDAMFEEDKDAQCFRLMPEIPVLLDRLAIDRSEWPSLTPSHPCFISYATKFEMVCEELKDIGLRDLQRRSEERVVLYASHEETCTANQKVSVRKVQEFEEMKQKVNIPSPLKRELLSTEQSSS